jgi:hypothetical protein
MHIDLLIEGEISMNRVVCRLAAVLLLAFTQARAADDPNDCQTYEVTYPSGADLSGRYTKTKSEVNSSPLYSATAGPKTPPTEDGNLYLYKHMVAFTESGFVWVLSLEKPNVPEWRGYAYGDGPTPELAEWNYGVKVRCIDQVHQYDATIPSNPDDIVDLLFVYTEEARAFYQNECSGTAKPDCGVNQHIVRSVRALNEALQVSGLDGKFFRVAHVGPTELSDQTLGKFSQFVTPTVNGAPIQDPLKRALARVSFILDDLLIGTDSAPGDATRDALRELQARRKVFGADIAHVVFGALSGVPCGAGANAVRQSATRIVDVDPKKAFGFTRAGCSTHGVLAVSHEIGHAFGLDHSYYTQFGNAAVPADANQARGYVDVPNQFFTIMAYVDQCSTCKLIPYFSNPDVSISRNGKMVAVGNQNTNAVAGLRRSFRTVAKFRPADPVGISFWSPLDDLVRAESVPLQLRALQSAETRLYVYNDTANDILITDINSYVTGHLSLHSAGRNSLKGCFKSLILRANDFCVLDIEMTASGIGFGDTDVMSVLVEYKDLKTQQVGHATGEVKYKVTN